MAIFKCKMCGGDLQVQDGACVVECGYCGTKQTVSATDDEKRVNLYNRANHLRMNSEFDKAASLYEQIVAEFPNDAEAYWGLCLCNYGIEYVDDPVTSAKIPTIHRASFEKMRKDENYERALENADATARAVYQEQAKEIDRIMGEVLAISRDEQPYDVFICYKETDEVGGRTVDSVIAQNIYDALSDKGYKVFFSRITLEDKLGAQYEPYIFAALNSAKVMLAVGTDYEYYNAVWVKNEWRRFWKLAAADKSKVLIPCYKDMDVYDFPNEFKGLQAQDMGKVGAMQDLLRGIDKIFDRDKKAAVVTVAPTQAPAGNVGALLKRAFMFLEDAHWAEANAYCEKVLDQDPENANAYLGKLLAELQVKKPNELKDCAAPFDNSENYQKAVRFGDDNLKKSLTACLKYINERNEQERKQAIYDAAKRALAVAGNAHWYKKAAESFRSLGEYRDAAALAAQCDEKAEEARKNDIYDRAERLSNQPSASSDSERKERAAAMFASIPGWKDADEKAAACRRDAEEAKAKEEADRLEAEKAAKKRKKVVTIVIFCVLAFVLLAVYVNVFVVPKSQYNEAVALMGDGKYDEAIEKFEKMDGYKDSKGKIAECMVLREEDLEKEQISNLSGAKKGDTIKFGSYEQDNNTDNGKEEIEWQVLDVKDGKALVVSKYALDCQPYDISYTDVTWEKCTLRKWLNDSFLKTAFGSKHQELIPSVSVSADKNPEYDTDPGNATTDKVFLLSITEAEKYFTTAEARKCVPTAYAKALGAWTIDSDKTARGEATCDWWLRTLGGDQNHAAVYFGGSVGYYGYLVDDDDVCVRPAMWISLK